MNTAYPLGFQALGSAALLGTQIDLVADTIKVQAVGPAYTYSAAHQFLSDLSHTVGTPSTLTSKNVGAGVFSAANTLLSSVPYLSTVAALVVYKDTGSGSTSPLIAFLDTASGLPFTGSGGDVTIVWDAGAFRIFQF